MASGKKKVETPVSRQTLIIEDQKVLVEHRDMPLKAVKLDPHNPRIQHAVKQKFQNREVTQDELRKLILDQPGVSDLFRSIRDNGGISDPIHVRPDGSIIEGNCRVASYLKLNSIDKDNPRWQAIPAIFVPNITPRQAAVLQGQFHVAGKNKWAAYEKAGHMHSMKHTLDMDEKAIGVIMKMTEKEVLRDLQAYTIMTEKVLPRMPGGGGLDKWSFVEEFCKRKGLEEYRTKPANVDEFVSMVIDKRLKKGADVRKLEKVLKDPAAVKTLKKHAVDVALAVVGKSDPTADSTAFNKLKKATTLLQRMPNKDLQRLMSNEESRVILRDLFSALKDVAKAAGVKLT
ncbi:MAG: hypothetical protein JWM43_3490 [Acidobacteriaceae bacterium]|nr:hypothetical protein [Acidobacteriaceae bacterium]